VGGPPGGITSRQLPESRSRPIVEVTSWSELCPPRGQCGATALKAHSEPLFKTPKSALDLGLWDSAPGRNRTCDSRFRNSMQPRLPTCENTLKWVSEQAIPSLEDSFVTRRFPVFRGTTAGPIR
jgi:hypothetical protein